MYNSMRQPRIVENKIIYGTEKNYNNNIQNKIQQSTITCRSYTEPLNFSDQYIKFAALTTHRSNMWDLATWVSNVQQANPF